jgi:tyrosine-protein kinase Etk/Wzc
MSIPVVGLSNILLRLSHYKKLLVRGPLLIGLLVGVITKLMNPYYTAFANLLPPQTNSSSASTLLNQVGGNAAVLGASALSLKNPSDLYASLLLSRTVQDKVIEDFNLGEHYGVRDMGDLRQLVLKRTKVTVGKDGVINLAYTDKTSELSAAIANALIDSMYDASKRLAREDTKRRMEFYDNLIADARKRLEVADKRLMDLEMKTGLTRIKGQEESSVAATTELRGLIVTKEIEYSKARQVITDKHPEMQRMTNELASLRDQLARIESTGRYRAANPEEMLKQYENNKRNRGLLLSFQEYSVLRTMVEPARREVEQLEKVLGEMIKAREFSIGDETRDLSVMQVLDRAVPPSRKAGPKVLLNAMIGVALGFLLICIGVVLWDILFTDPERRERWAKVLREFPMPRWPERLKWRRKSKVAKDELSADASQTEPKEPTHGQ